MMQKYLLNAWLTCLTDSYLSGDGLNIKLVANTFHGGDTIDT